MRMKSSPKLRPNGWDALVAAGAGPGGTCGILVWAGDGDSGALTAVVSVDGEVTERVALSGLTAPEERTYTHNGYTLHVTFTASPLR